jgi:hypothetical protein
MPVSHIAANGRMYVAATTSTAISIALGYVFCGRRTSVAIVDALSQPM